MTSDGVTVGQLVTSRAGRDQGKAYLVVEVLSGSFVLVADGTVRRVGAAKKKNLRHLIAHRAVAPEIAERRAKGKVSDEDVRQALKRLQAETLKEAGLCPRMT